MCSTNKIIKIDINIQKEHYIGYVLSLRRFGYFLVFIEENAFKHFLYVNITKLRLFLFFSYNTDHAQISTSENWKSFKDYDVYLIITISP